MTVISSSLRFVLLASPLFALCLIASPALAQPGMADMRAADRYAALAASGSRLSDIRLNLQRVLLCLEGRGGANDQASAGACSEAGAAAGLPAGSANHIRVEKASKLAAVAVTLHDFKPAHFTALAVQAVLDEGARLTSCDYRKPILWLRVLVQGSAFSRIRATEERATGMTFDPNRRSLQPAAT